MPAKIGQDEAQERLKSAQESHNSAPRAQKALNINQHQSWDPLGSLLGHSWGTLRALLAPLKTNKAPQGLPKRLFLEGALGAFWTVPWERCADSKVPWETEKLFYDFCKKGALGRKAISKRPYSVF